MIGVLSVPATVVRLERIMRPANASVGASNNDSLAGVEERPNIGRMSVAYSRFDRSRPLRLRRSFDRALLRQIVFNARITFNPGDVRPRGELIDDFTAAFHQDCVNDVERTVLDGAVAQELQNSVLRCLRLGLQSLEYESTLFSLAREIRGRANVGLISEDDQKFCLLSIGSVFDHPWRDLVRPIQRLSGLS